MKSSENPSKLIWQPLGDDEQLAAATQALMAAEQVGLRLVARPTNRAAGKTITQHFAKSRLSRKQTGRKAQWTKRRGGRIWEHNDAGSAVRPVRVGDVCIIPRDMNLIRSLPGIRRFVEVAPA